MSFLSKIRRFIPVILTGLSWPMLFFACGKKTEPTLFKAMPARETGIAFENKLPEQTPDGMNIIQYLYYYNGGGVATGDLNNDGLCDLFFTSNIGQNALYLNRGNLRFEDATAAAGVAGSGSWKTGVTLADVNADGWLDIYVCQVGNYKQFHGKNQLFINLQNGQFAERAAEYGLDFCGFSTHAAFFDYDRDGDLDCYLLNHSVHSPESYKDTSVSRQFDPMASDRFYENQGRKFVDITPSVGLRDGKSGYGLSLCVSDFNNDNWPDVYVANDFHENDFLYLNTRKKGFTEVIARVAGHTSNFTMGCDAADLNNDLRADIVSLDMKPEEEVILKASAPADPYQVYEFKHEYGYHWQFPRNALQLNLPSANPYGFRLSEIGQLAGVATTDWSWSALCADFDLDGWKDLFISNGIPHRPNDSDYAKFTSSNEVQRQASDLELLEKMPSGTAANYAFRNTADLRFENASKAWGLDLKGCSNGAAYADLDNDGDLDLVLNNLNAPAAIFRNDIQQRNWIKIRFSPENAISENTFSIGAKALVFSGNTAQLFENQPVRGFQSCSFSGEILVGLGAQPQVDSVLMAWPDGSIEKFDAVASTQVFSPQKGKGQPRHTIFPETNIAKPLASRAANIRQPEANDLRAEKLLPWSLLTQGRKRTLADVNGDGKTDWFGPDSIPQRLRAYLPMDAISATTSCIRPCDADGDGDLDYFVGNRFSPGAYGIDAHSFILENKSAGQFSPMPVDIKGSVSDARWIDLNADQRPDLMIVGEWQTIVVWLNLPGGFQRVEIPDSEGLWMSLSEAADLDGDGDLDLVAGNLGLNTNLRASTTEPLGLWVKDFDNNGSFDPVITWFRQGRKYIFADKDQLVSQLPVLKKQFLQYQKYAESDAEQVFPAKIRQGAVERFAKTLDNCWLENLGNGQVKLHPLPVMAQLGPVMAALPFDYNHDGKTDLLLGGQYNEVQPSIGRFDALPGCLLNGIGQGRFEPADQRALPTGLDTPVRNLYWFEEKLWIE